MTLGKYRIRLLKNQSPKIESIDTDARLGDPLAPWTYSDPELFELEYEALFLSRWQFIGHVNDVPDIGDYVTADIGRDSIVVIRGKDLELRAFLNVCRHRASRILEGAGTCRGVVRCPYHGWTYQFDGSLMAIPQQENFPVAHPGLNRLLRENGEWDELNSGISYGVFELKDMPSKVEEERLYQEQFHHANHRVPDDLKGKWVQFSVTPNLGIDLYPEMLDMFQLIPLGPDRTMIRTSFYGHKNPTTEEKELRRLNLLINDPVNEEDRLICKRVQQGLQTHGYQPGSLSQQESCIFNFHEMMRDLIPVMSLPRNDR
jgi:phenylpropionate dioxygenase-like ring-hydroxylating dioxygenase large terminal subunit